MRGGCDRKGEGMCAIREVSVEWVCSVRGWRGEAD